jgi:hypothetical protein
VSTRRRSPGSGSRPLLGLVAAALLTLTACAPGTPDEDSWRGDAARAVGDVASAVQTARLGLTLARRDRLPHAYLQTVVVEAETNGGKSAQLLSAVQPPAVERRRASDVSDSLQEATDLLTETRIAVVDDDETAYADLADELAKVADDLGALEDALAHPPSEAAAP